MFKCVFCGLENPSEKARFCVECGPDGPAKDWTPEDIDHPQKVNQYVTMLSEFYFDAQTGAAVERFSLRMRERLKISHGTHTSLLSKLAAQKKAIAHLANFHIEFNENVTDAYAGHDTYLSFRYTNLSEDDLFKISLLWDDPETTDRVDFRAQTSSFVKPQGIATLGGSVIFDRMGIKELADMQITITDQFGESANFKAEPFSFKVGNHDQRITQNISTHNQISIGGRGVVDASGMGAEKTAFQTGTSSQPRWKELQFTYISEVTTGFSPVSMVAPEPEVQQNLEIITNTSTTSVEFDKDNLLSVLKAAEQGDAEAQKTLGNMYRDGHGVVRNYEQAVHWFRKAAEQDYAPGQNNLGQMYEYGQGVAKDYEKAVFWFRKAAEQGSAVGQNNLGVMYEEGLGVAKDYEKAVYWFRKAAEQGKEYGQNNLGGMYQNGQGVAKDYEKAVYWFRKAAEQGSAVGQNNLGQMYEYGQGVTKDSEKAVYWFRKAAEQDYAPGQNILGVMYQDGQGVTKDNEKAVYWFRKAAEQDYAPGQNNLGVMYEYGLGVAKDKKKAAYWYGKAAQQGLESDSDT